MDPAAENPEPQAQTQATPFLSITCEGSEIGGGNCKVVSEKKVFTKEQLSIIYMCNIILYIICYYSWGHPSGTAAKSHLKIKHHFA